ncbi:hypothetical protein QE152_g9408 [Popillia japonica]|uniref:DUF8207 domain-containing protein n=1 Tax=Popillia japonica TaxID=7064 RepID=A0AAW1LYZ5_POPJA
MNLDLHALPKAYMDNYLKDKTNEFDLLYGIRFDNTTSNITLGNAKMDFKGKDIILNDRPYVGTPGLYELIFKCHPTKYNDKDASTYYDILQQTNVYKRHDRDKRKVLLRLSGWM